MGTFAPALGLSHRVQVVLFFAGAAMVLAAGVLALVHRRRRPDGRTRSPRFAGETAPGDPLNVAVSGVLQSTRLMLDTPTDHDEWLVHVPDFRVTNRSAAPINIDVALSWPTGETLSDGSEPRLEQREGEWRRSPSPRQHLEQVQFHGPFLEGPLAVGPYSTIRGKIGFIGPMLRGGNEFALPSEATLRISEHQSGREVSIPLYGGSYPPTARGHSRKEAA